MFLRSVGRAQTNWTFEDTLTQIGLGYPLLFLLGLRSPGFQWGVLGLLMVGYWVAWATYPLPGPDFDYAKVGVPPDWPYHATGLAAHWNKNNNLGAAFDQWFLNLFPREKPFVANGGGYLTLSFIPTLGTMLLGLVGHRVALQPPISSDTTPGASATTRAWTSGHRPSSWRFARTGGCFPPHFGLEPWGASPASCSACWATAAASA